MFDRHEIVAESSSSKTPVILTYLAKHAKDHPSSSAEGRTQHEINRDFALWFVRDMLLFENAEKPGFQGFFNKNMPGIHLPTKQTMVSKVQGLLWMIYTFP